jgi:hypothetical protein
MADALIILVTDGTTGNTEAALPTLVSVLDDATQAAGTNCEPEPSPSQASEADPTPSKRSCATGSQTSTPKQLTADSSPSDIAHIRNHRGYAG